MAHASSPILASSGRRGFTLVELLVVLGIMVMIVALAVPVLGVLSGNRSIEGAQNNVSAMLNVARTQAMAQQRYMGVLFFIDPATNRVNLATVYAPDGELNGGVDLDAVADQEYMALPSGVGCQLLNNPAPNSTVDRYLGYNTIGNTIQFGGVILFGPHGQLVSLNYRFRIAYNGVQSAMGKLLYNNNGNGASGDYLNLSVAPVSIVPCTQFGLALFDRDRFQTAGGDLYDVQFGGGNPNEAGEETWIDSNSAALLVNRYNGTLIKAE